MAPIKRQTAFLGLLLVLMCVGFIIFVRASSPRNRVPIDALYEINTALLHEGFKLEGNITAVDSVSLGPLTPIVSRMPGLGGSFQKRSIHRQYDLNGSKLGIDFDCTANEKFALNASISADPTNCAWARKIVRELSAINPSFSIGLRTNAPVSAAAR